MATKKEKSGVSDDAPRAPEAERSSKALRHLDETFEEWRHEPTARGSAYLGAVLLSLGGLLLGASTFAFARIAAGPWRENAWLLLAFGLVFELAFLIVGGKPDAPLRVGDLGVGRETEGKVQRVAWCDITRISLVTDGVKLETADEPILIGFEQHSSTAARVVAEAKKRIPKRVVIEDDDVAGLGKVQGGARVTAEPPQVTMAVCRATGEALTFEKDVRMCRSCGALYHRNGVPRRCSECSRKLRAA